MLRYQWVFYNHQGTKVYLVFDTWLHILENHPEVSLEAMENTLSDPDLIVRSSFNAECEIYFLNKKINKSRFWTVVVKIKSDGIWVATAMTKDKPTNGHVIYRRK